MSLSFFRKTGIVNVKMVITEEKILSNIDKIQKLINPNSKKQIVQLEEDSYFKDLVESVKTYLLEYPRKKTFPANVYKSAYDLVEYATNQFEENTKKIEELIRKRERNIKLAGVLRDVTKAIKGKARNWKEIIQKLKTKYSSDVVEALTIIGNSKDPESEDYKDASKLLDAKIANLESNLHIEIDMERIEDRSKALSYIGIEIAEALKYIPAPAAEFVKQEKNEIKSQIIETEDRPIQPDKKQEIIVPKPVNQKQETADSSEAQETAEDSFIGETEEISTDSETKVEPEEQNAEPEETTETNKTTENVENTENTSETAENTSENKEVATEENNNSIGTAAAEELDASYFEETRFDVKPSLWQRIKNSKIVKTISFILKIRVVLDYPALPDGNVEK